MSFIDSTYFVRDINVPFNNASASDAAYSKLLDSISRYENEVLKSLLGYTLWKELLDDLNESGVPQTQKWIDFVNGAEFSFELDGQTVSTKWNGIVNSDKVSLLSYYVYFKHRFYGQTSYSGIGETKAKGENSTVADGSYKITGAWNNMINLYGQVPYEYTDKIFFQDSDNYVHYNDDPSAYNFLLANISDYSGWAFTPLKKKHNYF